jgi:uncharacterized protein (TIGR03435 family)
MAVATAGAQEQPPAEFEVASVKRNTLNDRIVSIRVGPGRRFTARGYTLVLLMQRAYHVMDWNVTGGPSWIRDDRFDVAAKANVPGDLTEAQLRPMLKKLLEDRFRLKLHRGSNQISGYAVQLVNGSSKLKPAEDTEEHPDTFRLTNVGMRGQAISMLTFARFFGGKLGLIAVDETGLTGLYDFNVDWKVDTNWPGANLPGADAREPLREAAFEAAKSKLGLKLVPKRVTIEMLVIDDVQKLSDSEN